MTGKSHTIIGLSIGLLMSWPVANADQVITLGTAALAAKLPDIDLRIRGVAHRGITHSLLTVSILFAVAVAIDHVAALAFVASYTAHIIADMTTISGVRLLWPAGRSVHLMPKPLRLRTGSTVEALMITVISMAVLLWILQASGWSGELPELSM